jgi:hypothetical protein
MCQAETGKVKDGLSNLFNMMINPLMKEFQPKGDDEEGWQAFEGAYEEALPLLPLHIIKALNRQPVTICGPRTVSS